MKTAKEALKKLTVCEALRTENNGEPVLISVSEKEPVKEDGDKDPFTDLAAENGEVAEASKFDIQKEIKELKAKRDKLEKAGAKKDSDEIWDLNLQIEDLESDLKLNEGIHFHTKIKKLEANEHPVKIRLGLKEVYRMVNSLLDPSNQAPNPADDDSKKMLETCSKRLIRLMDDMRKVQVRRRVQEQK